MRFELFASGRRVGSVWWEGAGRVGLDVPEAGDRDFLQGYFAEEDVYLSGAFGEAEAFDVRRRDETPWGFERACRGLAAVRAYRVFPERGVGERREEASAT